MVWGVFYFVLVVNGVNFVFVYYKLNKDMIRKI